MHHVSGNRKRNQISQSGGYKNKLSHWGRQQVRRITKRITRIAGGLYTQHREKEEGKKNDWFKSLFIKAYHWRAMRKTFCFVLTRFIMLWGWVSCCIRTPAAIQMHSIFFYLLVLGVVVLEQVLQQLHTFLRLNLIDFHQILFLLLQRKKKNKNKNIKDAASSNGDLQFEFSIKMNDERRTMLPRTFGVGTFYVQGRVPRPLRRP